MRIVRMALVAFFLGSAVAACGSAPRPAPVLAHADSTAGLRVRISDKTDLKEDEDDGQGVIENRRAHHELVMRLKDAGYVVVEKGPYDLRAATTFTIEKSKHDNSFTWARIRLRDRKGNVVDDIKLEFRGGVAPATEPNIVAVSLVNEMTKSPKLSTFAQQKRAKAAPAEAKPESTEATPTFAP